MYQIRPTISEEQLRKLGFRKGREWPGYEKFICNEAEYSDLWLVPLNPDEDNTVYYADEHDNPIWYIQIQSSGRVWIDCVPCCTYHIDSFDMEEMFSTIYEMIRNGYMIDDYKENE